MLQAALRDVARRALQEVADDGMPGDHHFFIQLSPQHPEVIVPEFLKEQHPEELTLILQHQYWNLHVEEDRFYVTLSFGGKRYDLEIPFDALIGFADPEANFALRFEALLPGATGVIAEATDSDADSDAQTNGEDTSVSETPVSKTAGAKGVEIDAFRKSR